MKYDYTAIEHKWQDKWEEAQAFRAENKYDKPKYYALVEFPYPSGQCLHVGHPRPSGFLSRPPSPTTLW